MNTHWVLYSVSDFRIRLETAPLISYSTMVFTWYLFIMTAMKEKPASSTCDITERNVAPPNAETINT